MRVSVGVRNARQQGGVTLVELLVAMAIALILTLVLFSALQAFEGRKRTTVSVNDINQAGNWAAYALDKWVRSAGSGFSESNGLAYGCTLGVAKGTQILPRTAALPAPFASVNSGVENVFKLIPLLILPGQTTPGVSGHASDVLLVMAGAAGNGGETAIPLLDVGTPTGTEATIQVRTTKGFGASDLVLVTNFTTSSIGGGCMVQQVDPQFSQPLPAALPAPGQPLKLKGPFYDDEINGTILASTFKPGIASNNAAVIGLGNIAEGNAPIFQVIGVGDNNTLFTYDLLESGNPVVKVDDEFFQVPLPIADGVFEMHALYGVDTDDDGKADTWTGATGDYAPARLTDVGEEPLKRIRRIKAVRVGLILRTSLPEKDEVEAGTSSSLSLFSDLGAALTYTRALTGDERHFRYRTIEQTIPLRNQVMISTK